ncbi:dihydrofolate reductase family protein [Thermobifida halotolerans]|uniref:Dihydrofolate reductase family protein n=1 Tax=Thermobifida halotolerans TaxID=483545 RepID=A0A399G8M4_9ACTN|nr:dihydrofolate reductase family protein [Thermobifida halotolerans]UOE21033.1 dihydrofolate reductase family protein [Thermobifida halotolerans]
MRTLTYYVGTTIDGFIAGPGDEVDFYPVGGDLVDWFVSDIPDVLPTHVRARLGVADVANTRFDTVIQGRRTYEPALAAGITSPYAHLRQYVVSRSMTRSPDPAVRIVSGDALEAVRALKAEDGLGVYLAGGAALAGALLPEIDELVVKLYPVVAGSGVPLFTADFSPRHFALAGSRVFDSGVVVLTYTRAPGGAASA